MAPPNSEPSDERLDAAYRNLERIDFYVNHADNKGLIFLTFDGVIAALLAANSGAIGSTLGTQRPAAWQAAVIGSSILFLINFAVSLLVLLRALFPDTTEREHETGKGRGSLFFFATIARMPQSDFRRDSSRLDKAAIESELLGQIYANADVATKKFQRLKHSVYWLLLAFAFLFIAVGAVILSEVLRTAI